MEGWRRKGAQKLLLFPILVPIALTCGDEDLIIHSGRTYGERYLEGRLSSVLFGPIASLGCRDFRARTLSSSSLHRRFRIVRKESSAVRTRRDRKVLFGKDVQPSRLRKSVESH